MITKQEEAAEYVAKELNEVKKHLDNIADETGMVFFVWSIEASRYFVKFGQIMTECMDNVLRLVPDRCDIANKSIEDRMRFYEEHKEKVADNEKY